MVTCTAGDLFSNVSVKIVTTPKARIHARGLLFLVGLKMVSLGTSNLTVEAGMHAPR